MQVAVHAVAVFALCVPCASLAQGRVVEGVVVGEGSVFRVRLPVS